MLTLVHITRSPESSADAAALIADYTRFVRERTCRRQYVKAFGGLAGLVLLGAAFGRVPGNEAAIAAALLALPPLVLVLVELRHWRRLVRRLGRVRSEVQIRGKDIKKS
jgi:hypothetical protein